MITLERAAELVSALREMGKFTEAHDLFAHFELLFQLHEQDPLGGSAQCQFAELCGFQIATSVSCT